MASGRGPFPGLVWWLPSAPLAWWLLFRFLAHRFPRLGATLVAISLPIGLSWALMPAAEYLPVGNKNLVFASLQPPPGYNLNQLTQLAEQIESHLRPYWQAHPAVAAASKLDGPCIDSVFMIVRTRGMFFGAQGGRPVVAPRSWFP